MRPRFSLRMLFIATAVAAGFLYYWILMPQTTARRFVDAITAGEYEAADRMYWKDVDRGLALWNKKYWGMRAEAEILPWSLGQFLDGRRNLRLHVMYFFLDENHDIEMQLAATSFGIDSASTWSGSRSAIVDQVQRVHISR
jgi:hypothetical protein